ncbi:hypothetical protein B0H13DRAFT_2317791 [Mycena leptocephala]|nr:hypothetical protein B0H13DRAFT_2317791 [Mycena leptocephala]
MNQLDPRLRRTLHRQSQSLINQLHDKAHLSDFTTFIPSPPLTYLLSDMSQSTPAGASLVSAAPPAAETADSPAPTSTLPSSTPVVVYNISDIESDGYSAVDDSVADTSLFGSDAGDAPHNGDVSTEAEDPQPPKGLSLPEAFELLSIGAAAVSQALSTAAAKEAADAAAAAAPAAPAAPVPFVQSTGPWIAGSLFNVVPAAPLAAVPDNGEKWYAITKGKYVGLTPHNLLSSGAVMGVSSALQNSYTHQADALAAFNLALTGGLVHVL